MHDANNHHIETLSDWGVKQISLPIPAIAVLFVESTSGLSNRANPDLGVAKSQRIAAAEVHHEVEGRQDHRHIALGRP